MPHRLAFILAFYSGIIRSLVPLVRRRKRRRS